MIFSRIRRSGRPVDIVTIHNLMLHNLVLDPVLSFHILGAFNVPLRRSIFLHAVLQSLLKTAPCFFRLVLSIPGTGTTGW